MICTKIWVAARLLMTKRKKPPEVVRCSSFVMSKAREGAKFAARPRNTRYWGSLARMAKRQICAAYEICIAVEYIRRERRKNFNRSGIEDRARE
jgi:hypothetical protein